MGNIVITGSKQVLMDSASNKEVVVETPIIVVVTFNANQGTTPIPESKEVVVGGIYGILSTTSRIGHTFNGWFYNSNLISFSTVVTETVDHTLIANWGINQYTVSFNPNGGTLVNPITQNYDTIVNKPTNPTRTGYTFNDWYYDTSLTQLVSWPFNMPNFNQVLYAKWTPITYTVAFNGNNATSGTAPSNINATYDVFFEMPQNTFTRTGFQFISWNTSQDGTGINYNPGQSYSNLRSTSGTITLYARWQSLTDMIVDYSCQNGVWSFSLLNINTEVQGYLNLGYKPRIQLVRYHIRKRSSVSILSRQNLPLSIRDDNNRVKPNYPSYLDSPAWSFQPLVASIDISSFSSTNYTNMNLSTWANNMIKFGQKPIKIRKSRGVILTFDDFGYFFINYQFVLLINRKKFGLSNLLQARYNFLDVSTDINTNYTISGGILNVSKNVIIPTLSAPTINSGFSCTIFQSFGNVVTVNFNVSANNSGTNSITIRASFNSDFSGSTTIVLNGSSSGNMSLIHNESGQTPGTVTVYARAEKDGFNTSSSTSRTETVSICNIQ